MAVVLDDLAPANEGRGEDLGAVVLDGEAPVEALGKAGDGALVVRGDEAPAYMVHDDGAQ